MPRIPQERLDHLEEIERRYHELAPYAGVAASLATEFSAASESGASVDAALAAAETAVRAELTAEATDRYTRELRYTRGPEIEREIEETRGDELRAKARREFEEKEEPALQRTADIEVESRITREEKARLRQVRPREIRAEVEAERGDAIRAAARDRFAKEDEPRIRAQTERDVELELAMGERDRLGNELRQRVREEKFRSAEEAQRQQAELEARLQEIKEVADASHRLPFDLLRPNDVLRIEFVEHRITFEDGTSATPVRTLHLSVRDQSTGKMLVLDDDWQKGDPLQKEASLTDGSIVFVSTAIEDSGEDAEHEETAMAFTRGVPLSIRIGSQGNPALTRGYEVHRVYLAPEGNKTLLLGSENRGNYWT